MQYDAGAHLCADATSVGEVLWPGESGIGFAGGAGPNKGHGEV